MPGLFSLLNKKLPIKNPIIEIPQAKSLEEVKDDPAISAQPLKRTYSPMQKKLGDAFNMGQQDLSLIDCLLCRCPKRRQIVGKYTEKSLMLFSETGTARAACIQIIESKYDLSH